MPWEAELRQLKVVAGILRDGDGRVLIAERLGDGPFNGLWEFPGGKIGDGEGRIAALARELAEEIDILVLESRHFLSLEHDYPDRSVAIDFFLVDRWEREPRGMEGQRLRWVAPAALGAANLLPADEPVIAALRSQGHREFHSGW